MSGHTDAHAQPSDPRPLSRREFLTRAGWTALGAALFQLPGVLRGRGWLDEAAAQNADLTLDTMNGLVAFAVPGPDVYSIAQEQSSTSPGGIAARAGENMIQNLDAFLAAPSLGPFSSGAVPLSGAVANLLNSMAASVDPTAASGGFPSHFSRLSFANKVEVFRRLEGTQGDDDLAKAIRYLALLLPGFAAFCCYNEWHVFDEPTRTLSGRPVGWDISNYYPGQTAAADGWPELLGYYKGRKKAER